MGFKAALTRPHQKSQTTPLITTRYRTSWIKHHLGTDKTNNHWKNLRRN